MDLLLLKRVLQERGLSGAPIEQALEALNDPLDRVMVKKAVILRDELALGLIPAAFALADRGVAVQAKWDRIFRLWLVRDSIPNDEFVGELLTDKILLADAFERLTCTSTQRMEAVFGYPVSPDNIRAAMAKG